jgi:ADP-heptose:LPS heptosyltransferase
VLDFHGDLRSGVTGLVAGAPVRLGYSGHQQKEGNFLFTTHRVRAGDRRTHRVERNLDLVRALELPDGPVPDGGLALAAEAIDAARAVAGASEPYAVIAAGVSRRQRYKRPPPVLLAAAAAALAERGVTPLVVWGPGEREDAEEVATRAVGGARLAPPTDLPVLAALLRRARVYVGGDTGPLHLACAVGCPTLGLYGPTDPVVNGPWRVPGIALSPPGRHYTGVKGRDRRGGFDGLTAELVRGAVEELLRTTGARSQAL